MPKLKAYAESIKLKDEALLNSLLKDTLKDSKLVFFKDDADYKEFVDSVAKIFGVSADKICVVGSSKLGFSIKTGLGFDEKFSSTKEWKDKSDVDIAIVSNEIFIELLKRCWKLTGHYRDHSKWVERDEQRYCIECNHPTKDSVVTGTAIKLSGLVCEKHIQNNRQEATLGKLRHDKVSFFYYLAAGWFRRDLAPLELRLDYDKPIIELRKKYDRKVSYAVYADFDFFKEYQKSSIRGALREKGLYD